MVGTSAEAPQDCSNQAEAGRHLTVIQIGKLPDGTDSQGLKRVDCLCRVLSDRLSSRRYQDLPPRKRGKEKTRVFSTGTVAPSRAAKIDIQSHTRSPLRFFRLLRNRRDEGGSQLVPARLPSDWGLRTEGHEPGRRITVDAT